MLATQPQSKILFTASGVITTASIVGLPGFTGVTLAIPTGTYPLNVSLSNVGKGYYFPIKWDILNTSTTDSLQLKFGSDDFVNATTGFLANYVVLGPGQSINRDMRHPVQEIDLTTFLYDLAVLRIAPQSTSVSFSVSVDCWIIGA